MELFRKICNFAAVLCGGFFAYILFVEEYLPRGFKYMSPLEYILWGVPLIFGPWIVVHYLFKFIGPRVESQIQDVQYSKSVKNKNYLVAFSEVEENRIENKELWAKAFAQCDGNTEKQKSIYVELRTKELSKR